MLVNDRTAAFVIRLHEDVIEVVLFHLGTTGVEVLVKAVINC